MQYFLVRGKAKSDIKLSSDKCITVIIATCNVVVDVWYTSGRQTNHGDGLATAAATATALAPADFLAKFQVRDLCYWPATQTRTMG